jgi:hypothetical protein
MAFAKFMAGPLGRIIRIVAGVALIALGLLNIGGTTGVIVAIVGAVPVLAGLFNVCLVAPLIGAPFSGSEALRR